MFRSQIVFHADYADLILNVTGNNWPWPIETAEARITLPDAVPIGQAVSYGGAATIDDQQQGRVVFRTTRPLTPGSALTVSAAWQGGVVKPPHALQQVRWWIQDELPFIIAMTGTLALLSFYLIGGWYAGRHPSPGKVERQIDPPDGMSAGAMRYIARRGAGIDDRTLAAAMLDMEVRGRLQFVVNASGGMQIEQRDGGQPLEPAELAAEAVLFSGGTQLLISNANRDSLGRAKAALEEIYARTYADQLFHQNAEWACCGAAVSLIVGLSMMIATAHATGTGTKLIGCLVLALLAWVVVLGFQWFRTWTFLGRQVMDCIDGFRGFLADDKPVGELAASIKPYQRFEALLPYAVALDIENTWARGFANPIAAMRANQFGSCLLTSIAAAFAPPAQAGGGGGGGDGGGGGC